MAARAIRILAIVIPLLALGGLAAWHYGWLAPDGGRGGSGVAALGGPFTLVDQNGKERTAQDFRGKLMLIYFGYTYCPDVCPTALQVMSVALDQLGDEANEVQPIFITIDPERDTPQHLKKYVANFGDRFIGLTGSEKQVDAAARAYRVYYRKAPGAEPGSDSYLMDHSSIIFLMGRDGSYLAHFTHNTSSDEMASTIREYL